MERDPQRDNRFLKHLRKKSRNKKKRATVQEQTWKRNLVKRTLKYEEEKASVKNIILQLPSPCIKMWKHRKRWSGI
ncbi:hypothetical protein OS493_026716 [Desmophyllum pertusum]|uniref:Uncharacterized protein n=1 Tax=Desmophyllum pertusum TaxID=174260 RepID=A0A9X0D897_9CNID|nr:hypothetical protein OS493_026716 [Desmophyllum pertusum]